MINMPVSSVEMQEYLFAESLGTQDEKLATCDIKLEFRKCFRFQRFAVMNWLMLNGVSIPSELLSDQTHPFVGQQFPDQKIKK